MLNLLAVRIALASGARLWHKRTMEAELDLDQASRETLLEIIAELRQRVESLEKLTLPLPQFTPCFCAFHLGFGLGQAGAGLVD